VKTRSFARGSWKIPRGPSPARSSLMTCAERRGRAVVTRGAGACRGAGGAAASSAPESTQASEQTGCDRGGKPLPPQVRGGAQHFRTPLPEPSRLDSPLRAWAENCFTEPVASQQPGICCCYRAALEVSPSADPTSAPAAAHLAPAPLVSQARAGLPLVARARTAPSAATQT
jgi:hypothetical protein